MISLTHEEEAILRPQYEEYISCMYHWNGSPCEVMSFDDWWREKADYAKDRAKYQD